MWPPIVDGTLTLTPAQLALLVEAMDYGVSRAGANHDPGSRFAADSPLEEAVSSEPVSEAEIPC